MPFIDISLPLQRGMPVYPGNPAIGITARRGRSSRHSDISMGSHTGTHIDAPRHVFARGKGTDAFDLRAFIGLCRVLDCTGSASAVMHADLDRARIRKGERILLKTRNSACGFKRFYDDYVYLHGDAAEFLADQGAQLVGIDALSIKQRGSDDNRPHTALLKRGIVILEGLDLSRVIPGHYTLLCLPLNFIGLDGAPARAVLSL